ncbi:DUF4214 domain-containing protein [Burkholderia cenocepacia]|nr:hypothetical protein A8E88_18055 [Burkholderia cenocepacia]MBR7992517.1 DUF4214 domain-containing protein [Burkholderia cenocepacia]ONW00603.1 hypothetical protein A8E89_01415 [Burkholderia cenocepacia]ONW09721.1 hypothetical protein A8E94_23650 [Burkholderia cenocepacia]ONW24128.1 hypothetical protein A8E90_05015 [Burkholderia cenocepacia]
MQTVILSELLPYNGEQLIEQCYQRILLREPDPEGRQHYRRMLGSGRSKFAVVRSIARSAEARKLGTRVHGMKFAAIGERVMEIPVLGTIIAAFWLVGDAPAVLRDIRAGRELASEGHLRIGALETQLEQQRDLDPIFNTVNSSHQYMRDVERRLAVLESKVANGQVHSSQSESSEIHAIRATLAADVQRLAEELDSLRNFASSIPATMRAIERRMAELEVNALNERERASQRDASELGSTVSVLAAEIQRIAHELEAFKNFASSIPATMRDQLTRLIALKQEIGQIGTPGWKSSISGRLEHAITTLEAHDAKFAKLFVDATQKDEERERALAKVEECAVLAQAVDSRVSVLEQLVDHSTLRAASEVQRLDQSVHRIAQQGARLDIVDDALGTLRTECARLAQEFDRESLERGQLASRIDSACELIDRQDSESAAIQHALNVVRAEFAARAGDHASSVEQLAAGAAALNESVDEIRASIQRAYNRIEFVRRETLFELKYGAAAAFANKPDVVSARIINTAKVEEARVTGLKLNVGCGHIPLADHVNVDSRELPGVDIVAEATGLPFGNGEVSVLRAAHLIEHFPQEQLRREVLPYWRSILKSGGTLHVIVPDAEHMFAEYYRGTYPYEHFRTVLFGGQDYGGDFHYNMLMPDQLSMLLREAGFETVRWLARGRKNGLCFEMELEAE